MLTPRQLEKYADVLLWGLRKARQGKYKPYDLIMVRYEAAAQPLMDILYKKLIQQKFNVAFRMLPTPSMEKDFYVYSDIKQRGMVPKADYTLYEQLTGNIYLSAPTSLTHLKDVDPKRIGEVAISRKPLRAIVEKKEEQGTYGWTLCTLPTEELAKKAKLSLKDYTEQIVRACFLNEADPVKTWEKLFKDSLAIKRWLNALPIKTIEVETKSMHFKINYGDQRKFIGISGHNIPSFELFTSPDWRGAEGVYFANLPSYRSGNYVEAVRLEFKHGRVVKATAKSGEDFVRKMLAMDRGAAQIGEFSLTDKRFSKINKFMADILFDENFGGDHGNCHIAIGSAYSDTFSGDQKKLTPARKKALGFNDSALHWDLINTEQKVVTATLKNGQRKVIYEKGCFTY